jgi:uncharacterized protein YbjT (DUF2867 family)
VSVKTRLVVSIAVVLTIALGGLVAVIAALASDQAQEDGMRNATSLAVEQAQQVEADFSSQRGLAQSLSMALAGQAFGRQGDRKYADALERRMLTSDESLLGIWSAFEPNAFDGKDAFHRHDPKSDATGRYISYWFRDGADISVTPLVDYETEGIAEAAHRAGIRRFVLTSILTSDQTPGVPHFWHKKLAEDRLEQLGVPFVALRPGAFVDQIASGAGNPLEKGRVFWIGKTSVPLTFVRTSDLAAYLAQAVDADAVDGERIDIGWDRPVSIAEVADQVGGLAGTTIKVRAVPSGIARVAGAVAGPFMPILTDMTAMFRWFDTGRYVADPRRQQELFGPAPRAEDALAELTEELRTEQHR